MKTIIFSIILTLSFQVSAQSEYNYYSYLFNDIVNHSTFSYQPNKNVKQITFTQISGKNKKTKTYIKKFNENGKTINASVVDNKGKTLPLKQYKYDSNDKVIEAKTFKRGIIKSTYTLKRNKKGKVLAATKTNTKGKKLEYNEWSFNKNGDLSASVKYKKDGEKIDKRWEYEYYDAHHKSKSTLYNSKGKIINVWSFDCKEEGEKLTKKKKETQVCKWEETSTNHLIKTYQTFDDKGKIIKYVTTYTLSDTLIVSQKTYNNNDVLIAASTYDKDYRKPLKSTYFRKGKMTGEHEYKYKNDLKVYHSFSRKGNLINKIEYYYNDNNLLTSQKQYNNKEQVVSEIKLAYIQ